MLSVLWLFFVGLTDEDEDFDVDSILYSDLEFELTDLLHFRKNSYLSSLLLGLADPVCFSEEFTSPFPNLKTLMIHQRDPSLIADFGFLRFFPNIRGLTLHITNTQLEPLNSFALKNLTYFRFKSANSLSADCVMSLLKVLPVETIRDLRVPIIANLVPTDFVRVLCRFKNLEVFTRKTHSTRHEIDEIDRVCFMCSELRVGTIECVCMRERVSVGTAP